MINKITRQAYEAPSMIEIGSVEDFTAGPVTPYSESPSGQKGSQSDDAIPVIEEE